MPVGEGGKEFVSASEINHATEMKSSMFWVDLFWGFLARARKRVGGSEVCWVGFTQGGARR
jgi:hypothetical protein